MSQPKGIQFQPERISYAFIALALVLVGWLILTVLILTALFGAMGRDVFIEVPFHCPYGVNIHLGDGVYMNSGCVILDCARVEIGDKTLLGPQVQIYTAIHPLDPEERASFLETAKPVTLGRNVWIGGGAIVLPGVTIGDGAIVGAGAVVTRDVAPGATVAGTPARAMQGSMAKSR